MKFTVVNFFDDIFLKIIWNEYDEKISSISFKVGDPDIEKGKNLPKSVIELISYFEYFYETSQKTIDLDIFDFSKLTKFQIRTYYELYKVPFGKIITYKELAILIGNPNAIRAVGGAMKRNPFPIVIPCHRVLAKNHIGGFSSGIHIKEKLLKKELNI